MLDLDAGIHLDEEELAVLVEEFEGACAPVADAPAGLDAAQADLLDERAVDTGRGSFLDDLLVSALERAVAIAEPEMIVVLVAQDLNLDVAWLLEKFLDIDLSILEGLSRFCAR